MKPATTDNLGYKLNAAGVPGLLLAAQPLILVLTTRRRALDDYGAVDGSALVNIAYTFLVLWQCLVEIDHDSPCLRLIFKTNLRWFAFFTLWGGLTAFWSVNSALTIFRTLECAAYFLLIAIVAARLIWQYGISGMFGWFIRWYLLANTLLRTVQQILGGAEWRYVVLVPQMTVTVFFYLVLFHERSRPIKIAVAVLTFISRSTTAYIGLAIGSLSLWFGGGKKVVWAFTLSLVVGFVVALIGPQELLRDTVFRDRADIGMEHTSGRDKIWEYGWERGKERPWGGYGFFSAEPYLFYGRNMRAINAHNSVLSAFLGTGFPGLVLILLYMLSYIPVLLKSTIPITYRSALMGCYAVALLHCLGNPGIGSRVYGSWMSVTILFVMISTIDFYHRENPIAVHEE